MEIQVAITIDGQAVQANYDLQNLLQNLVGSYIRQSISGAEKKPKVPKVKDSNAPKREARKLLTEEELQSMLDKAATMQTTHTMGSVVTIISNEMGRSPNTVYLRLRQLVREGKMQFLSKK